MKKIKQEEFTLILNNKIDDIIAIQKGVITELENEIAGLSEKEQSELSMFRSFNQDLLTILNMVKNVMELDEGPEDVDYIPLGMNDGVVN